jgi:FkbM family methyltransferase
LAVKELLNPLFSCAARVCEKSPAASNFVRNFAFAGKNRIVARVRPEAIGPEIIATCQGVRYRLDLHDHLQRDLYFNCNPSDELELRCALHLIPVGGTCIDVGANIGVFALPFAKRVGDRGTVHAFEPDPANFARLEANAVLNGFDHVVKCHQLAVSNASGEVSFYRSDSSESGWGSMVEFKDISVGREIVRAITLDDFLAAEKIEKVDLLKVDVEAHEPELLEGSRRSLGAQVFQFILIECNGVRLAQRGKVLDDLLRPILGAGYLPQFREQTLHGLQAGVIPFETVCTSFMFAAGSPV